MLNGIFPGNLLTSLVELLYDVVKKLSSTDLSIKSI